MEKVITFRFSKDDLVWTIVNDKIVQLKVKRVIFDLSKSYELWIRKSDTFMDSDKTVIKDEESVFQDLDEMKNDAIAKMKKS